MTRNFTAERCAPELPVYPMLKAALALTAILLSATAFRVQAQPATSLPLQRLLGLTHVHGLAVDRKDPSRLLIATHHGLYVATLDGSAQLVSERQDDFMGFTPHPKEPATLFASGHPSSGGNLGFMNSIDGGRTWQQLSPGVSGPVDFHQMDVSKADPRVIYGQFGGLQVSRDGGHSWNRVGAAIEGIIDLAASARDANTLYIATQKGLQVSHDGGNSWRPAMLQTSPATMVDVTQDGTVYAFLVGIGLLRAREPELGWEKVDGDLGKRVLLHLAVDPGTPTRLLAVAQGQELIVSKDAGKTWQTLSRP
jgi:hypothetical protein